MQDVSQSPAGGAIGATIVPKVIMQTFQQPFDPRTSLQYQEARLMFLHVSHASLLPCVCAHAPQSPATHHNNISPYIYTTMEALFAFGHPVI
ncbi:hypothetical protein P3342_012316 [Pyrenophora teres f. teres]|nr:hypothetical protein P3342_012316 [Pyrenophora teres f. teres]